MAVVLMAGCTGGMGSILLNKINKGQKFQGRKIEMLIALDYFPNEEARLKFGEQLTTPKSMVIHWDASSFESTSAMARQVDAVTEHLDGVLITTGMGFHGDLSRMSLEDSDRWLQRLMQVNAVGPSLLSQFCAKKLAKSPMLQKNLAPTLLMMSSFSGLVGLPHRAAYCSSKFALNGYLETIFSEFPQLRMVLVCPTSVSTAFRDNWKKTAAEQGLKVQQAAVNDTADLTPEQCVAAVWGKFNCDVSAAVPGFEYDILPKGKTSLAYWLIRLPYIGERFVRPIILGKASKL
eukprot:m.263861 g.263861  ORF g.263861 m.263861 type:complete len:291 (+) comp52752_c0_seq1:68-940(+)